MNNRPTNNNPLYIDYIIERISYFSDTYSLGRLARVSWKTHETMEKSQVLWKERLQRHYPSEFQNACQNLHLIDSKSEAPSYYKQFTRYANEECQSWPARKKKVIKALREDNIGSVIKAKIDLKEFLHYLSLGVLSRWEENYCAQHQHVLNYFFQKVSPEFPSLERDVHGYSLLEWAALLNQKDTISDFINNNGGGNFNEVLEHLNSALFLAAREGHIDMVELLLTTNGIQVNAANQKGFTPLHIAAEYSHVNVVERLLKAPDIQVNADNQHDNTPLHIAVEYSHVEVVERLLKAPDIQVNATNINGSTPLYIAAAHGHIKIVELLLNTTDIQVNVAAQDGETPLYIAAYNDCIKITELLLNTNGIQVNAHNKNGYTPLFIAAAMNHIKIVELLSNTNGIQVNAADQNGDTPLHIAEENGYIEIVELLSKTNANVDDEKREVKKSIPQEISVSASSASHYSNNSTPLSDEKSDNDVQPIAIDNEAKETAARPGKRKAAAAKQRFFSSKRPKTSPGSNNATPLSDEKSDNDVQSMAIDNEAKEEAACENFFLSM